MSMKAKILDVESTKEAPACNDAVVQTTKGCCLSSILSSHYFAYFFQALANASQLAVIVAFRASGLEILNGALVKSIFIVLDSIAILLLVKKALQLKAQGCNNAIFVALIALAQLASVVEEITDFTAPAKQTIFNLILLYTNIFVGVIVLLGTCCRPAGSSFIGLLGGATLVLGLVQFIVVAMQFTPPFLALLTILSLIAYALDITVIVNFIDSFDEM